MFNRAQSYYKPIWRNFGLRYRHRRILLPHLNGLFKLVTPCVCTQHAPVLGAFSLAPKMARFVKPLLIPCPLSGTP